MTKHKTLGEMLLSGDFAKPQEQKADDKDWQRTVTEARNSIGNYVTLYNQRRPHSSLDGVPPDTFHYQHL